MAMNQTESMKETTQSKAMTWAMLEEPPSTTKVTVMDYSFYPVLHDTDDEIFAFDMENELSRLLEQDNLLCVYELEKCDSTDATEISLSSDSQVTNESDTLASSSSSTSLSSSSTPEDPRFKPFHEERWTIRYKELLSFLGDHGHAAVPHTYPENPQLARWIKRQRRQFKLLQDKQISTMTSERLELLNDIGFVWDSHDVNWREKLDALLAFREVQGHCNVPSNNKDKKLATWVKVRTTVLLTNPFQLSLF
jgi:hypothetical protein